VTIEEHDARLIAQRFNATNEQVTQMDMSHDEQPNPDQTGTWEPDWISLGWKIMNLKRATWIDQAKAVVAEYRRQQAERGIVEMDRERAEHLDRLWRFAWFERECVKNHAFDLWGEALDEIRTELDALGEPPRLPKDAGILSTATDQKS
jgi:hypothetical protein